jgi:hypothetical protein
MTNDFASLNDVSPHPYLLPAGEGEKSSPPLGGKGWGCAGMICHAL